MDDYWIAMRSGCSLRDDRHCSPASYAVTKLSSYPGSVPAEQIPADTVGETRLPLPVPAADGQGGLFDALMVRWIAPCAVRRADHCRKQPRLVARFVGLRLEDLKSPDAKGW
jgi:hypothetical protein